VDARQVNDPQKAVEWPPPNTPDFLREVMSNIPPPTASMDPRGIEAESCEDALRKQRAEALERSIPQVYRWARLSAPELGQRLLRKEALGETQRQVKSSRIVWEGSAGAGKTSLAVALLRARAVTAERRSCLFVPAYRLAQARIQHPAGHGEAPLVETAIRCDVLLLDDVGNERDHAANAVPDVIFERDAADLPTWVTVGKTRAQLASMYGAGIVRRLFERATVIRCSEAKAPGGAAK
jgi:DNA replication protein DnaC